MLITCFLALFAVPLLFWYFAFKEDVEINWRPIIVSSLIVLAYFVITAILHKTGIIPLNSLQLTLQYWPLLLLAVGIFKTLPTKHHNLQIGVLCLGIFIFFLPGFERFWCDGLKSSYFGHGLLYFGFKRLPYIVLAFVLICVWLEAKRNVRRKG